MKTQFIAAADASLFTDNSLNQRGITTLDAEEFFHVIQGHTVIRRREELDLADTALPYRQFLPYNVFSRLGRDFKRTFFAYRRKPKSGEAELHGKVSIGIGGHVDAKHLQWLPDSQLDLIHSLATSALDEKMEELDIFHAEDGSKLEPKDKASVFTTWTPAATTAVNLLLDDSDNVGKRHFALVTNNLVPLEYEIKISEAEADQLETLGFLSYEELTSTDEQGQPKYNLEGWTKICLEHFNKTIQAGGTGVKFSGPMLGGATKELVQETSDTPAPTTTAATSNIGDRIGHRAARKETTDESSDTAYVTATAAGHATESTDTGDRGADVPQQPTIASSTPTEIKGEGAPIGAVVDTDVPVQDGKVHLDTRQSEAVEIEKHEDNHDNIGIDTHRDPAPLAHLDSTGIVTAPPAGGDETAIKQAADQLGLDSEKPKT